MTIDDSLRRDLLSSAPGAPKKIESADPLDLDQLIVSSSKQVLLKKIEFQAAEKDVSFCLQNLRGKYEPLNSTKIKTSSQEVSASARGSMLANENGEVTPPKSDGIPKPKMVLFHPEKVRLDWQKCHRVGAGLINMGNTCFLNSTLQCLSYTPPLANYLLSHQHKEQCRMTGFCMMCELHNHLVRVSQHHGQAVRPMVIIHKLKHIAKHMHLGRQEDAHEFLRYVIEAMQKSSLYGYDKLEKFSKETSVVHQIFGGYYRSRVICSLCQHISDTFDPFLDIGLDIKHVSSVNKALDRMIRPDMLDGDNKYKCGKCKRQVAAQKRFTIHRSSNILTLCLKKFDFQRFGSGKLHKDISYPEVLNVRPYMSDVKGPPVLYNLYAVLTHQGSSCNSGHYFCFVRAPNKMWYCMNDAHVTQASLHRVMNQDAYLLFYIRKMPGPAVKNGPKGGPKERIIGPSLPMTNKTMKMSNGQNGNLVSKKPEVQRPPFIAREPSPRPVQTNLKTALKPATVSSTASQANEMKVAKAIPPSPVRKTFQAPLAAKRDKISFSFKNAGVAGTLQSLQREQLLKTEQPQGKGPIDKGKRITQKMQNMGLRPKPAGSPRQGLVPYGDDDSSESDSDENYDDVAKRLSQQQAPQSSESGQPSTSVASTSTQSAPSEGGEKGNGAEQGKGTLAESTDLTAIQSHDSPLKLTITTNGNAQRIKSTSTWHVGPQDSLMSPSINSESSTGSVSSNSTQEWNVSDRPKNGSRKSRKENSGVGKHRPPTFPMLDKNGREEGKGFTPGESEEVKSSVIRQITFGEKAGIPVSENGGKDNLEESIAKQSVTNGKTGSVNKVNNQHNKITTEGSKKDIVSKVPANVGKEETTSNNDREKQSNPKLEKTMESSEDNGTDRTIPHPQKTTVSDEDGKAKGASEGGISMQNGQCEMPSRKDDAAGNSSDHTPSSTPKESKLSGVKERLFKKINSHRQRKRRRRDSEDDTEGLLSKEDQPVKQESLVGDREWYVVGGQGTDVDSDRVKKKKKKKKRKHREEEGGREGEQNGPDNRHGVQSESELPSHSSSPDKKHWVKDGDDTGRSREGGPAVKGSHGHAEGGKHKRFVEDDEVDDHHPQKRLGSGENGHSDREGHIGRKRSKSVSDDSSEETRSNHKAKRRHESNSSEASSSDRSKERRLHHHRKSTKRKHLEREKGDRKPLLDDYEEGEVRSPEREEVRSPEREEVRSPDEKRQQYYANGGEDRRGAGGHHSGQGDTPHHKHRSEVYEQSWDHHIKDSHKKSHHGKHKGSWDGRRSGSDDVVKHLTKSSMGGYGSMVQSWDGGKSLVDEEAEKESRHHRRRDSYDEEFDQGRVKKVKKRADDSQDGWRPHRNPFQHYQNSKNKGRSPFSRNKFGGHRYQRFGHKSPQSRHGSSWR